jgi:hypothetical protein
VVLLHVPEKDTVDIRGYPRTSPAQPLHEPVSPWHADRTQPQGRTVMADDPSAWLREQRQARGWTNRDMARPGEPQILGYRGRQEPGMGDSTVEHEVLMAAHEASDHAEQAEEHGIGEATLEQFTSVASLSSRPGGRDLAVSQSREHRSHQAKADAR